MSNEYFGLPTKIENLEELNNGLTRVKVFVAYPDKNRKKIDIPREVFNNALNTALGMPIVAHFFSDGKLGGHTDDMLSLGFDMRKTGKTYAYGFVDYNSLPQWETIDGVEWLTMVGYLFTERFPESRAIISSQQSMEVKISFSDLTSEYKVADAMSFLALCSLNADEKSISATFEGSKFVKFTIGETDAYDDQDIEEYYKRMKELFAEDEYGNVKPSDKLKKRGRPKKIKEVVNSEIHEQLEDSHNNIEENKTKETEDEFVENTEFKADEVSTEEMAMEKEKEVKEEMAVEVEIETKEEDSEEDKKEESDEEKEDEDFAKEVPADMGCGKYSLEQIEAMETELMSLRAEKKALEFDAVLSTEEYSLFSVEDKELLKSDLTLSIEAFSEKADALAYRKIKTQAVAEGKEKSMFSIGIPKTDDVIIEKVDDKPKSTVDAVKQYISKR